MAEAALSEQFAGISTTGSSSGSGPGARGGGSQRPPSYPGMPMSGPDGSTRSGEEEGRQVIIPLDASDSYDDCKDKIHEKMSAQIAEMKAELEAKSAELEGERLARAALEKRLADQGSSRGHAAEAAEAAEAAAKKAAAELQAKLAASEAERARLRATLEAQAAEADAQRAAAATMREELAQTTDGFKRAMAEVVALTSEITQLRQEQEDRSLVSHLEAHTRHEEEIQRELQRLGHAHEQELRRLEEAYSHVHSALTQQSAASEPDLLATDDAFFGSAAGEDPIPRATRLSQRLAELPSLFDSLKARECRKIALQGFALGELALFFPVPSKNNGSLPPPPSSGGAAAIHQNYLAFNVLPKQPRFYIADESMALIGRKGVRHFNRKYVLGMIIEKTLHKADAASASRYDIPIGTSFYTLLVNEVDYWS